MGVGTYAVREAIEGLDPGSALPTGVKANCFQMFPGWTNLEIRRRKKHSYFSELVVGAWRFELQTSCVTGRRSDQLNYVLANLNQQQRAGSIRIGNGKLAVFTFEVRRYCEISCGLSCIAFLRTYIWCTASTLRYIPCGG